MNKSQDIGLLLLRLSIGGLMLIHGISKLIHGLEGIKALLTSKGLPSFLAYGTYVGEVIAPLLILIGFRVRLASAVFAFNMLVAMFLAHSSDIFKLSPQDGSAVELIGLYLFGAIALFFTGAGKHSLSATNRWD